MVRQGCCKHFTGISDKCCAAGVSYDAVTKDFELALPCYTPRSGRNADTRQKAVCDKYEDPTAEEIAAHEAETKAFMDRFTKTLPLIAKVKAEHKGQSWQGVEVCPVCSGKLHMSHAACNGHVWGRCETEGCLSWME